MKKTKVIAIAIIFIMIAYTMLNCIFVGSVNAADYVDATETSTTSTGKTVTWKYTLDSNGNIYNLKCTNGKTELTGTVTIPSTIDGHKVISISSWEWLLFERFII